MTGERRRKRSRRGSRLADRERRKRKKLKVRSAREPGLCLTAQGSRRRKL